MVDEIGIINRHTDGCQKKGGMSVFGHKRQINQENSCTTQVKEAGEILDVAFIEEPKPGVFFLPLTL